MITFRDYLEETPIPNPKTDQELMNNAFNAIPKHKRDAARRDYKQARSKNWGRSAAMTLMVNLHREETALDEAKWESIPDKPATDLKRGDKIIVRQGASSIGATYLRSHHGDTGKAGHRNGHLVKYNDAHVKNHELDTGLAWHQPDQVFRSMDDYERLSPRSNNVQEGLSDYFSKSHKRKAAEYETLAKKQELLGGDKELAKHLRSKAAEHHAAWEKEMGRTIGEEQITEMGDTVAGQSTLKSYIKKRIRDLATKSAVDALHSGTQFQPSSGTVTGLDPVTKKPIYQKDHPHYKEGKMMTGISRAVDRLK